MDGASHTIVRPTSVDLKAVGAWGLEGLSKARFSFDT
jgi:C-22 sterol desaturase